MINILLLSLLLAPFIGFLINGLRWQNKDLRLAGGIGSLTCFISFLSAVALFFHLKQSPDPQVIVSFLKWVKVGGFESSFAFLIDPLSIFMLLIITGIGFLIHLFSIYYMSHDQRPAKYFAYLNLFLFSMSVLVLADNLLLMFIGWEGVGLCSYLLIGFWFTDKQKASAGMKAFIVNRVGDMGFLVGMFLLFTMFSSLNFTDISSALSTGVNTNSLDLSLLKWTGLCLFIGAIGKSAQIPLYIWLPSAMAGPTPVSALIHAATMVTAGIYLIVRMSVLFSLSPEVLTLISWTGALTAFLSALIASAQSDIKKVLAYSTVSQLGYMFMAVGIGAFSAGLFHLLTHAFFKALLFLSAGAIIHALNGEQNIYRMGGLRKFLPITWICFLFGFLALIGIPPLSGFFSKDEILWSAFASGHYGILTFAGVTALITAFYMSRLYVLVFHGAPRLVPDTKPHEGGFFAHFPLVSLALLSIVGGFLGIPHLMSSFLPSHPPHLIETYLKPVISHTSFKGSYLAEALLMIISSLLALAVMGYTMWLYLKKASWLKNLKLAWGPLFNSLEQALWVDSFCEVHIVRPVLHISHELWEGVDNYLIQGLIALIKKWLLCLQGLFQNLQNGKTQSYILFMVLGVIVFILAFFY